METFFVPLALIVGGLLAVQAAANMQLSRAAGSPLTASTVQIAVGTAVLLAVTFLGGRLPRLGLLPDVSWWHWLGGLGTAIYITSTILLFPRLGAVVSVGLFIAGQMLASLALDGFGLLGVPAKSLGGGDALGALAVAGGTALIVGAQSRTAPAIGTKPSTAGQLGWIVLGLIAGAALPIQGAVNAQLRADLHVPFVAATISFAVATVAMVLILFPAIALGQAPRLELQKFASVPWWGWLGGLCGAAYVTAVFTAIPVIGAAAVVGLTVVGQQIASVFFDRYGFMRLPARPVTTPRLGGVFFLLVGVALIQLS
jgi:bacterial/archaeal transporter family-2 protein